MWQASDHNVPTAIEWKRVAIGAGNIAISSAVCEHGLRGLDCHSNWTRPESNGECLRALVGLSTATCRCE